MGRHLFPVLNGLSPASVYRWGDQHSALPGLSALCYLLPLLPLYLRGRLWEMPLWVLQATAAALSDGVYPGRPSVWHAIDRLVATAMTALNCSKPLWLCSCEDACRLWCALCIPLALWCFFCSKAARDFRGFVVYHTLWHAVGGLGVGIAVALEGSGCT